MTSSPLLSLARDLCGLARAAGDIEMKYFREGFDEEKKHDGSPVTQADREAEALIFKGLKSLRPDIPVVGEENVGLGKIPDISSGYFWLVDPLDGTREFVSGGGDFTVNIALLDNFHPVLGVIFAPVSGRLFFGAEGQAFEILPDGTEKRLSVRETPAEGLTVVTSKRHNNHDAMSRFLKDYKVAETRGYSSSLKFCALAAGEADLYPRLGPTSEWDTAAGQAILEAAGGSVTNLDGGAFVYGKAAEKFLNPGFIAKTK